MKVPCKCLTPFRLFNFSHKQASHIGAVLMPCAFILLLALRPFLPLPTPLCWVEKQHFPSTAAWVSGWVQPVRGTGDQSMEGKRSEMVSPWSLRLLQSSFKKAALAGYNPWHLPRSGSPSTQDLKQPRD